MDISSILGLVIGFAIMIGAIATQSSISTFWSFSSVLIVFGGTLASFLISYPIEKVKRSLPVIKKAFYKDNYEIESTIEQLSELSLIAKKSGLLALEKVTHELNNPFLIKAVLLVVDGIDPKVIEKMLTLDVNNMINRHTEGEGMLKTLGKYAPAMGMIGTLVGLIAMLKQLNDPSTLGPAMSVALITTFYGSVLANMVFLPLAGKLRYKSEKEVVYKMMIIEGILSVQAGESPLMIKDKLKTFIEENQRDENKGRDNEA